jgi:hypothetical protein
MDNLVHSAEIVGRTAHVGQVDKAGVDYSEHLKAVAAGVETDDAKAVAWLHDIVEDTPVGPQDLLNMGFPKHIVDAVLLLTHTHESTYEVYVLRIRDADGYAGSLARAVKLADLKHNCDPARDPGDGSLDWLHRRYAKSIALLGA